MAVLGLAWWAAALDNVSGNKELCGALDDAIWVIQHIVSSLKIGREGQGVKRAGDSSFDTVLAKRWALFNLKINLVLTAVLGHAIRVERALSSESEPVTHNAGLRARTDPHVERVCRT